MPSSFLVNSLTLVKCPDAFVFKTLFCAVENSFVLTRFSDGETSLDEFHRINHSLSQSARRRPSDHPLVRKQFRVPARQGGNDTIF